MRLIETDVGAVRAVAVSPDGRFVAAAGEDTFGMFEWATGTPVPGVEDVGDSDQVAFDPTGEWAARVVFGRLYLEGPAEPPPVPVEPNARFTGAVGVSPGGKMLVATAARANSDQVKLARWTLPGLRPLSGFDLSHSPFRKLAFAPDGEYFAGIWSEGFELRFAASGGLDYRHFMPFGLEYAVPGFVSFDRHSETCAFGWEGDFHVLDVATGTNRPVRRVEAAFSDAGFLPGADLFATVGFDGLLKLWNPDDWHVVREYDWGCGSLTALAFTADGSAGVCGTADGRLVQFDIDL
ncbi:MAG: WD40 repeat domain-containing protein [Gemmataceae bacterium]|nr:WD40 repeat domain-containing protein [Gemmataceae bacterium]